MPGSSLTTGPPSARQYNHLAILPHPSQHEQVWPLQGGGEYTVRPIHPDDASMLSRFTLIEYDREMALVAVHRERRVGAGGGA